MRRRTGTRLVFVPPFATLHLQARFACLVSPDHGWLSGAGRAAVTSSALCSWSESALNITTMFLGGGLTNQKIQSRIEFAAVGFCMNLALEEGQYRRLRLPQKNALRKQECGGFFLYKLVNPGK